ncbi:MAG: glycine cleavage system protein GcvH [Thermocrispum sp.]
MTAPTHLSYTAEHEWLAVDGQRATVGITAFAADALGDVVFIDLPAAGAAVTGGDPCGEIESTKSVSEIFAPADGEIVEVNDAVADDPALLNTDPYGDGWLFRMTLSGPVDLLDAAAYDELTGGQE